MSEVEIKQMQKKIEAGIQLARKRLIEKTKKEDGTLVVIRDGKVAHSRTGVAVTVRRNTEKRRTAWSCAFCIPPSSQSDSCRLCKYARQPVSHIL